MDQHPSTSQSRYEIDWWRRHWVGVGGFATLSLALSPWSTASAQADPAAAPPDTTTGQTAGAAASSAPRIEGTRLRPFHRSLSHRNQRFQILCDNAGSLNTLRVIPGGTLFAPPPVEIEVDGTVSRAAIGDLDGDGWPEIYVFAQSAGSGSHGSVLAWVAPPRERLQLVRMQALEEHAAHAEGYMGHDRFRLIGQRLERRFPVYRPEDSNARPTGGTRVIRYRLRRESGEWVLRPK